MVLVVVVDLYLDLLEIHQFLLQDMLVLSPQLVVVMVPVVVLVVLVVLEEVGEEAAQRVPVEQEILHQYLHPKEIQEDRALVFIIEVEEVVPEVLEDRQTHPV